MGKAPFAAPLRTMEVEEYLHRFITQALDEC